VTFREYLVELLGPVTEEHAESLADAIIETLESNPEMLNALLSPASRVSVDSCES